MTTSDEEVKSKRHRTLVLCDAVTVPKEDLNSGLGGDDAMREVFSQTPGRSQMQVTVRPIEYPGKRVAAGKHTEAIEPAPDDEELRAFDAELEAIASAEREAAADADLIHLA
jgi:hypothetical protein